jgi:hypothetical protein
VHAIYSVEGLDGATDGVGVGAVAAGVVLSVFVVEGLASLDELELSLDADFEPRLSVL